MADLTAREVAAITVAAGALAGAVVAGVIAGVAGSGNGTGTSSSGSSQVTTAPVVRTDLSATVQVGGSIGYNGSYTITALGGGGGVYTSLPQPGQVIKQGQALYSVSNQPVPLLYGSIPAYRSFTAGMSDGPDVGQLNRALIALGYGTGLTRSNAFTSATAAAIQQLQHALGDSATGELGLGQVFFEPGPIQIDSISPSPGTPVQGPGSTILTATSLTPVVTVDLDVSQEYLVKPGDAVTVVLPDGVTTVGGHIETVGTVATCPGGGGAGTGSGGSSPCESSGSGNASTPTVTVTISLNSPPPGAAYDQAPVNVNITTQTVRNVLAVPVNALLALQDGGYGVDVATGGTSHLAGVTTGVYSNTLVQVSGSGIAAGARVEVPAS
jgi:Putative peptidoglycan binding domain